MEDVEKWRDSYSRINTVVLTPTHLILQMQTPGKSHRYIMLFYNRNGYTLESEIPTHDYFLGAHKDRLCFFAGGNPGINGDIGHGAINICAAPTK